MVIDDLNIFRASVWPAQGASGVVYGLLGMLILAREPKARIRMSLTKEQILAEVKSLGPQERQELIENIWQMLDVEELSMAQRAELLRRIGRLDRGEAVLHDGPATLRDLIAGYNK